MKGMGAGYIEPSVRIGEATTITRQGITLDLAKAPGETPDHLIAWMASERILFCGDNWYHAFPNLYAIRGTAYRDFDAWADTMDQLMAYQANVLAPGHTMPVFGASQVETVLTDYRDAIRHVVRETVDGMNKGQDPVTISANLRLPAALAEKPYLHEFYGSVAYASRAYFAGTLGWFDGNPTSLGQLAPVEEAHRMIKLVGGADAMLAAAADALDDDAQWAMELADRLLAVDEKVDGAKAVKIQAMRTMADSTMNAPTRNYYFLSARELADS